MFTHNIGANFGFTNSCQFGTTLSYLRANLKLFKRWLNLRKAFVEI